MFTLKIKLTNAAFEDNSNEVARLLAELSVKGSALQTKGEGGTLFDFNGNTVGTWSVR